MATTRIKDISKTTTDLASDTYGVFDGATNGTQKMSRNDMYADWAAAYVAAPTTYKLAPLNSGTNKIDATYLPTSGDTPKGEWNANTNSPALADGSGTAGDYYDVTTAGTQDLGSGSIAYTVGDVVKYNGSTWFKIDSVANILDGSATAADGRSALSVNSIDEDAEATGTKLVGPAMYFNGSSSVVTVADDDKLTLPDDALTIHVVIQPDGTLSTDRGVVSKDSGTNREWSFVIDENGASDQLRFILFTDGSNYTTFTALTGGDLLLGKVQHISFTYDGTTGVIYRNGKAEATTATPTGSGFSVFANTSATVNIGKVSTGTFFKGHFHRFALFNRCLTATEIAQLARGNDLGFADEWGGAFGGVYTSDFSAGVDGWSTTNGTAAGNIDTIGGQDDNLRLTIDTTNGAHIAFKSVAGASRGKRYRMTADIYIPSTNSHVDGVQTSWDGVNQINYASPTLDTWFRIESEHTVTLATNILRINALDGGSTTVNDAGGDDVLYIRNIKITEIGTLADFRAENFIADKLIDLSSNNFVGTNNGATLVGGRKALQLDTDGAAAGNKVLSVFNGSSHLASITDKGDLDANSIGSGAATELTISSGAVTVTKSHHTIDTESDAASDDLDTINGGRAGQLLILRAANGARDVVLKDGTGNLKLSGDITLDNTEDTATLVSDGTSWYLLATSNNGA